MPEKEKAIFHAVLALVGAVEALATKSTWRAAFAGAMSGFHVYAVYDHIRSMRTEKTTTDAVKILKKRYTRDGESIN